MDKRYAAVIVIALSLVLLALGLWFLWQGGLNGEPEEQQSEDTGDTTPPVTVVFLPEDGSWHKTGFLATILDSDLDSGFSGSSDCQYIIQDLGTDEAVGGYRPCGEAEIFVSVGEGKTCSSSFNTDSSSGRCLLSTKAVDRAGNESSWEASIFLIDTVSPAVSASNVQSIVQPGEKQVIEATVSDNGRITRCDFFVDDAALNTPVSIDPIPCQEGTSCTLSVTHIFQDPGDYEGRFACADEAGNVGVGEAVPFRVFVNEAPSISSCKVVPLRGVADTQFRFEVAASDKDGDELSYAWDFGGGAGSQEQSPSHSYSEPGTYMPKVVVQDPSGETDSCETAWVIVE